MDRRKKREVGKKYFCICILNRFDVINNLFYLCRDIASDNINVTDTTNGRFGSNKRLRFIHIQQLNQIAGNLL